MEEDEVTVSRKLYRSGESEYRIGSAQVRLRDVYELFLDTGLGRDGYSVIGQGKIAENRLRQGRDGGKFLRKLPESPNSGSAAPRRSAAWPPPGRTWTGCGTFWGSWKDGWNPCGRRAKRPRNSSF